MLDDALEALRSDIDIAIYDASNINQQRRRLLKESVAASGLYAKASGWEGGGGRGLVVEHALRSPPCVPSFPTCGAGCDVHPSVSHNANAYYSNSGHQIIKYSVCSNFHLIYAF